MFNRVVEWLRTQAHDSVHLRDEGLQRLPKGEIFQKAANEQRFVLTFDMAGQIVSVILFACVTRVPPL